MSNIVVKDGLGVTKYLSATGVGDNIDPYVPAQDTNITNSSIDVNIQDQSTDTVILPLAQTLGTTTLASGAVEESYDISVVSATGITVGDHIRIFEALSDLYYYGTVLSIVSTTITLDTPLDYAYSIGSEVTINNINMAVDGSVTPVHFHLRTGTPSIPSEIDITRMIMVCQCDTAVDLNKFGDLPPLERGLLFRQEKGGILRNIFNIKSNAGLVGLAYDWSPYTTSNPAQGVHGFGMRLTFGSPGKIGVVIRVEQDGQLGLIVQDDLTDLVSLFCVVEGHVVEG